MEVETSNRYIDVVKIHWTRPCELLFYKLLSIEKVKFSIAYSIDYQS
jgi:hypothetical protein